MKWEVLFAGLLLAAVEAQDHHGLLQRREHQLETCVDKCMDKAVKGTKCNVKNHNCVCSKDTFMSTIGHCVHKNCGEHGFQVALDKAGHFCTDGRHPSSIPFVGPAKSSDEIKQWLPWWDWWRHWVDEDPDKCKDGKECDYLSKQTGFAAWQAFWGKHNKEWEHWKSSCTPKKGKPKKCKKKKPSTPGSTPPGYNPSPSPGSNYPPGNNPSPNPYPPGNNPSPNPYPPGNNPSPNPYPPGNNPSPNPYPPSNPYPTGNPYPPSNPYPTGNPYPPSSPTHYTTDCPTQTVLPYW